MQHLIDAVRRSVREQNWYAALTGALTLPDIAAKVDGRPGGSGARYIAWFNDYLLHHYISFLSGNDCYALRCAWLHEGDLDITGQSAQRLLEQFHFMVPGPGTVMHLNQSDQVLQLQVDIFCEEVCIAVETWLQVRGNDPVVAAELAQMPLIHILAPGETVNF